LENASSLKQTFWSEGEGFLCQGGTNSGITTTPGWRRAVFKSQLRWKCRLFIYKKPVL